MQTFGAYAFWAITHNLFWGGEAKSVFDLPFPLNWIGRAFGVNSDESRSDEGFQGRANPQSISEIDPNQVVDFVTNPQTQAPRLIMSFLAVSMMLCNNFGSLFDMPSAYSR